MAQLIETAIHEAGHTIMALKFNKDFDYVTIISKEDSLGHIKYVENVSNLLKLLDGTSEEILEFHEINKMVQQEIIIKLSGYNAELKFGVENKIGAKEDLDSSFEIALSHEGDGESASRFLDECLELSKKYVDDYWESILILAQKLIEHKTLNQIQVRSFLDYK